MRKYPVLYIDKFGKEETEISSDGSSMGLTLRGIQFKGIDFEGLEGEVDENKFQYQFYEKGLAELTNFRIEVLFPIKINYKNKIISEKIKFTIEVGEGVEIEGLNSVVNTVELDTFFGNFKTNKKVEWFEDAIIEIQNLLPKNTEIITCLSCKYSNYHPVGNGMFGSLYCFKKIKNKVKTFSNKHDLMNVWTKKAINKNEIFNVQELFDCADHKFISKEDWTYKDWDYKTNCVKH